MRGVVNSSSKMRTRGKEGLVFQEHFVRRVTCIDQDSADYFVKQDEDSSSRSGKFPVRFGSRLPSTLSNASTRYSAPSDGLRSTPPHSSLHKVKVIKKEMQHCVNVASPLPFLYKSDRLLQQILISIP